jgi:hypothetical protein
MCSRADVRVVRPVSLYPASVPSFEELRLRDALYFTVALNFTVSCVGLVVVMTGPWDAGFLIPLVCIALTGVVGLVALLPRRTRRLGGGALLGALVSILGFVAVITAVFVGYFVIGGNELS